METVEVVSARPSASDSVATRVKSGVRRRPRAANRTSRPSASSHAQPHTSLDRSRNCSVLPKRTGSPISSRCASISRCSASSRRRRLSRYQRRRSHSARVDMLDMTDITQPPRASASAASCSVEHRADGGGHPPVVGAFELQLFPAGGRQLVIANGAAGLGDCRRRLDPSLEQQLLERRIERALLDAQLFARQRVNALRDGIAVQRPAPPARAG